ncbi:MAG: MMPL family transporter [Planctomycetaceae bacterium]|nr:MMPL family transporter [Planctomycetaceae bacterium]
MTDHAVSLDKVPLLAKPLLAGTRLALRYPVATIVIALLLTVASTWLAFAKLGYRTSRADLINPNSDYNRLWVEYTQEFGDEDDAVVVVEGPDRETVVPVLEEISQALGREDRLFTAILHGVDLQRIRSKGLHYLSAEELNNVESLVNESAPIVDGQWARLNLGHLLQSLSQGAHMAAQSGQPGLAQRPLGELERISDSLYNLVHHRKGYQSPFPGMPQSFGTLSELSSEYLLTNEGKLGFVLLRLVHADDEGFARGTQAVDKLRAVVAQTQTQHPLVTIGLTGLPVMENDEMRESQTSMLWASLLSFGGVAILFIAGFGGLRHAIMANLVLLLAMAWAFGYVTLAVGHLNILSVSFTTTLIGIGIDYGVHYASRYIEVRNQNRDTKDALLRTTVGIGPAILTGALTTAAAFFTAGMTSFTGVAELGIIAGGGVLICCVAELIVLPACILLVDRSGIGLKMPEPLAIHDWIEPLLENPKRLLMSTCLFTFVVSLGLGRLWYDHNLLNLQAQGLESVKLEHKLLKETNQSVWYAVSMSANRDELLARKAKLVELPSVERVEDIVSLLPTDGEVKQPVIARVQQRLANLPERPPLIPVDGPEEVGRALGMAQETATAHHLSRTARQLELVRDHLRRLPTQDCFALLSSFQQHMAGDLLSRLYLLRSMATPEPPELSDLPESLVSRFVGQHDRFLMKIYGRGNIWDMDALARFVGDVRSVDPRATGNPVQAYEASLDMKSSYERAALYSFIVILSLLFFDFRNVRDTLLAALPLGIGVVQMFGIMGILNIPLNPANMIALPLVLGIGIDYGVHVIHDWRLQRGGFSMSPSTTVAVVVDGLTTIVGFGALMIASHQGLQSLGRVLTIGITCCMFTSLIMLPSLLKLTSGHAPEPREEPATEDTHDHHLATNGQHALRRDPADSPILSPHPRPATAKYPSRSA